jgi:hypothetical protein
MSDRIYLSNLLPHWPIKRQEELLDERLPGWRRSTVYRDVIPARKRQSHSASELKERARLLRPTGRPGVETITVVTAGVLAWATADFLDVLQAVTKRGAVLRMLHEDLTIDPAGGVPAVAAAMAAFERSKIRATGDGPGKGGRISGALRMAAAKAKCAAVRHMWVQPRSEFTDSEIAAEAGVSLATIKTHLGKRLDAVRVREAAEASAARNRARSKRREQN